MYNGIKRKQQSYTTKKVTNKEQILQEEEIEVNGIITKQLVFKTKEFKRDKSITWKDFEIANLIAAGIDPKTLPTTILSADIDSLHAQASKAEEALNRYEIIKELENEPTAEQAQQ